MSLNKQQQIAIQHAIEGHSLFINGAAGTGKSYVIINIVKELNKTKNVYVTATTGIACTGYNDAMTIHRWSGHGDGRYNSSEIAEIIKNNKQYVDVRQRITSTDVLIIDEISMMSKRNFECLNSICKIKTPDVIFGGIQLIVAGDFRQLPPVPNTHYGDNGEYCFLSPLFSQAIPHRVTLTNVVRQNEMQLIAAIAECSMGILSEDTIQFMETLKRPLPDSEAELCTMLFSTNEQVDDYNRVKILDFPGELYQFSSTDSGEISCLNKIIVPKCLWLKIGAPVILMRNLSDSLVNGLKGKVSAIKEKGPVIQFGDKKVPIPRMKCSGTHQL